MKNNLTTIALILSILTNSAAANPIADFQQLPPQKLLDTANYYFAGNSNDTALACYSLILNSTEIDTSIEHQRRMIEAYIKSGMIFFAFCDYRTAYNYNINALQLCEKTNDSMFLFRAYNNMGNIYYRLGKYDMAKSNYLTALRICEDTIRLVHVLNNLGINETLAGNNDSAFYFLRKSLDLVQKINNKQMYNIYNNIAVVYYNKKQNDSAVYYYNLALENAEYNNNMESKARTLANLGELFFKANKPEMALHYINLSKTIAREHKFLVILADNYLHLSQIAEAKGNIKNAFEHYKTYTAIKDSVFDTEIFGDINHLQYLYEISKTNRQIEQLMFEKKHKERTVYLQRLLWIMLLSILLLVTGILAYIHVQKRKLEKTYKILVSKNIEIVELQDNPRKTDKKKYEKSALTDDLQRKLLDKILAVMNNETIIFDSEFTLDDLAELVKSNQLYISQAINLGLGKNFRSLLSEYRIRKAQRLLSDPDKAAKYTIESVANQIGFKSQSAFRKAFKDITGVNPNFYLKSLLEDK